MKEKDVSVSGESLLYVKMYECSTQTKTLTKGKAAQSRQAELRGHALSQPRGTTSKIVSNHQLGLQEANYW